MRECGWRADQDGEMVHTPRHRLVLHLNSILFHVMPSAFEHLPAELARVNKPVQVETRYGRVTGGTAATGAAVFLGAPSWMLSIRMSRS